MAIQPEHRSILVVDVQGFSNPARTDPIRLRLREQLRCLLVGAFADGAVDRDHYELNDTGDGYLATISPTVAKTWLLLGMVPWLAARLEEHNRAADQSERLRLRVAVHAGELLRDPQPNVGQAAILACRLLDSPALRACLDQTSAPLALIVSDWIFQEVIRHRHGGLDPADYHPVWVTVKETETRGWIFVPGNPATVQAAILGTTAASPGRVSNLPPRNPVFSGREDLLGALRTALMAGEATALQQASALHGLGGVGKTQLAIEYAHRFADDYGLIWWVPAEQPLVIPATLARLGTRLGIPFQADQQELVRLGIECLARRQRWLLIFDNADDPATLVAYWPGAGSGHVMITTRNPAWGAIARPIKVDVLDREEAAAFLLRRVRSQDIETAHMLAEEVGDLPLALEQAGAYIEQTGTTLSAYLALFRRQRRALLAKGSAIAYHATVDTTWQLAIDRVGVTSPAGVDLLRMAAFLGPETIPLSLITEYLHRQLKALSATTSSEVAVEDALAACYRYSLVDRDTEGIRLHRLVQAVIRSKLTPGDQCAVASRAVELVAAVWPVDLNDPQAWQQCAQLLPHALSAVAHASELTGQQGASPAGGLHRVKVSRWRRVQPRTTSTAAILLESVAQYLWIRAEFHQAETLLERALKLHESCGQQADRAAIARCRYQLGKVLFNLARLPEACAVHRQALNERRRLYGSAHPDVAASAYQLGVTLHEFGEPRAALELLGQALEAMERTQGPNHIDLAPILSHHAYVQSRLGELQQAQGEHERALRIVGSASSAGGLVRIELLNMLGGSLHDRVRLSEARALLEQARQIGEAEFGPDHPHLAWTLHQLSAVLTDLGDIATASRHAERAVAIFEQRTGRHHPDLAGALTQLAFVRHQHGDLAAARDHLQRAKSIFEKTVGEQHFYVAWVLARLGPVLRDMNEFEESQQALEQAHAILIRVYGARHPWIPRLLRHLGHVLALRGDLPASRTVLDQAVRAGRDCLGEHHPEIAIALARLGDTLHRQGKLVAARQAFESAHEIFEGHGDPTSRAVIQHREMVEREIRLLAAQ
jgi:tetratricopeptide (TPR) repeat protein